MSEPHKQSFLRHWGSLVVLSLALAIIIIDTTLLNVSLTTIIKDLGTDIQHLQWVITAYALTLAALTITGGRFGDLFGRKNMFMLGAVLFAIGSLTASNSHNFGTLLLGESFIEGIGAALMMPATSSLLLTNFQGRERAIAFGVWGGIAAASAAIGPILGGFLTTYYSWRWGFRINVFVVILLLAGSFLVKDRMEKKEGALDWIGVVLSALGLASVVFGIVESTTYGWWKAKEAFSVLGHTLSLGGYSIVPFAIALGVILLIFFTLWELHVEKRGRMPLVTPEIFENAQFSSGVFTTAILSLGQAGLLFAVPVFLQTVRGLDALHTGYSFLPLSGALLVAAPLGAFLSGKVIPKRLIQFGVVLNIASLLIVRHIMGPDTTALQMAPGLALYGLGMGLVMSQVNNLTLSAVPVEMGGEASGINNTMRQLGQSLGSAIVGAVLISALTSNMTTGIQNSTKLPEALKTRVVAAVATQGSGIETDNANQFSSNVSPALATEIVTIRNQATADANRSSLLWTLGFAVLGLLVTTQLPNVRNLQKRGEEPLVKGH